MNALKTPPFWYRPPNSSAPMMERILTPFSFLYALFYTLHQKSKTPWKSNIPVLCLGNLVAGGTGKTPTAIALLRLIKTRGLAKNPFFLSRGYGGAEIGPILVNAEIHTAWDVGDEPLILSHHAPTIVSANRVEGVKFAHAKGADLILMDDGLQNPALVKDLKLIVINGEMGFGNGKMIPAGPLRAPLHAGARAADGFVLIGEDTRAITPALPDHKPLIKARLRPQGQARPDPARRYLAFAGLGYPEKFFNFLKNDLYLEIVECIRFADHYPYEPADLIALHEKAKALDATLITTEKDFMRLPHIPDIAVEILAVEMVFEDEEALVALIQNVLK